MQSGSGLTCALVSSIVAQRFSSMTTSTVPAASVSTAHRSVTGTLISGIGTERVLAQKRDEVNPSRPEGVPDGGADYQKLARKAQWGPAWLFAAAELMAFSTTELRNALPTDGELETKKTPEVEDKSIKKSRVVFVLGGPGSGKGT